MDRAVIDEEDHDFVDQIQAILAAGSVGMLCGSALSIFPPTCLEGGRPTSKAVATALCDVAEDTQYQFRCIVEDAAYEALLQQHPLGERLTDLFAGYFQRYAESDGAPAVPFNNIHASIAHLMANGSIGGIVTTNYDTCLEDAYDAASGRAPCTVRVRRQPEAPKLSDRIIFKLHGCARDKETMIFRLDQESQMPDWKRDLMFETLGRRIVVVGYSGLDFEVCPELYDLPFDEIYWIEFASVKRKPVLTSHARKVLKKKRRRSTVIRADMRSVLAIWSGIPDVRPDFIQRPRLSRLMVESLDPVGQRLWAARTFNMLGVPAASADILRIEVRHSPQGAQLSSEFELVRLGMLNHSMRYYDSADGNHEIAVDESKQLDTRVGHAIGESGAASMAGDYELSVAALQRASALAALMTDAHRRDVQLLNIDWMSLLLVKWKLDRSRKGKVRTLIAQFRDLQLRAFRAGDHFLRDLCEQEISELSNPRGRQPKMGSLSKSGAIFAQIGSFLGGVTVLHTRVNQTRSVALARKLEQCIPRMKLYGLPTWRLHRTLIDFAPDAAQRQEHFDEFRASIDACQFHPEYAARMVDTAQAALANPSSLRRGQAEQI